MDCVKAKKCLPAPHKFFANTLKVSYCKDYKIFPKGESYFRILMESEESLLILRVDKLKFPLTTVVKSVLL